MNSGHNEALSLSTRCIKMCSCLSLVQRNNLTYMYTELWQYNFNILVLFPTINFYEYTTSLWQIILFPETAEDRYGKNFDVSTPGWMELARVACLCSTAEFINADSKVSVLKQEIRGDASEQGILRCYQALMGNSSEVRKINPKVAEIPFNSRNKYQASVHDLNQESVI